MVDHSSEGQKEKAYGWRSCAAQLFQVHALVLFWTSFCWWQQQQSPGSTFFWGSIFSSSLGPLSIWVYCCMGSLNSMLAFNYFKWIHHSESPFEKGKFTWSIAKGLMINEDNDGNDDGDFNKILIWNCTLPKGAHYFNKNNKMKKITLVVLQW